MENESEREMKKQIEELVHLEDKLRETQQEMVELQQTRRRNWTEVQRLQFDQVQSDFNIKIFVMEFLLIGQVSIILRYNSGPQTKALIKLKISKAKLYEAKVGVVEMQKRWDRKGSGTRIQAQLKKQMNKKMKHLKNKWNSYNHRAIDYNTTFNPQVELPTPTLDDVKSFDMDEPFWNIGLLNHPNEPWAVDAKTKKGIQAYLIVERCDKELCQIAQEARQAIKWAIINFLNLENIQKEMEMSK
ncbi:hypothetical protein PCASD_01893 [Puccinia coronata f. sp. avenae]|uniref:Uncharacterized protein n=1 Tax=Puccinia coronata f. sp. avenae TaxID=200324 RepID=A0A2N5VJF8_9BASI|nr:hypothetical protein PCASD_01893 [Puccinia coronata f. sp. avenae]